MAKFDCIADFEALTGPEALSPAETKLIEACRQDGVFELNQVRPDKSTLQNTIRAALLRVLGSRLINSHSQKSTVAARAMAERKTLGHLS
jgi:hypothetical protein